MKTILQRNLLIMLIIALSMPGFTQTTRSGLKPGETILSQKNNDFGMNSVAGTDEDTAWIHYDNGCVNCDSWGFLISGEIYDVAAKWDPADLTNYNGWVISKVKFVVVNDDPIYKVKVWEGPSATEIYSQDIDASDIVVNGWTEITLDTPVEIDASTQLWVGYYVDYTSSELGGFVTATDDGPPVDGYGNLFRWNGAWYSEYNNHNLQVFIESNLSVEFESDKTLVCEGSSVNFTDISTGNVSSWSWTFEGGDPATSTEQNPTVMYPTAGVYDVSLTISDGTNNSTVTKTDYITAVIAPGQADMPSGDNQLCTGLVYEYSTNPVDNAASYDWAVTPEEAGTIVGNGVTVDFEASDTYTGSFTINVRAWNLCDYSPWSDDFNGEMNFSPSEFDVLGSGEICEGDPGVEITLSGSEVGVDYELYNNEGTTGVIVAGTGEAISFGLFNEQSTYTAIGFTASCSTDMIGEGWVLINFPPEQLTMPAGPTEVCNNAESVYNTTNAQNSDDVIWALSPENAGTIESDGMTATITWANTFEGTAQLTVLAENSCGASPISDALEIMVLAVPASEVTGDDLVCDGEVSVYSTVENSRNTYVWEVIGGTITAGGGTHEITVAWGDTPGLGNVIVNESMEAGCEASDSLDVTIDDCTGLHDNVYDTKVKVIPNPVTGNTLELVTGNTGTAKVQLFSISGVLMGEYKMNGATKLIDIASLPDGLYFIKVIDENRNIATAKFVKN